ncbi:alpha/beta hydrolase [Saccharospirillum sp. MSK14-1]|uniref:alpha/beta hydrolase n=1 Tax=Saccharospirillum sp. MSK14-1 TaxID=1897632 RepID=UPI000D3B8B89|nr:alpha/beta hydrolase [Saccharospirillum sp. MSK14-1]
MNLIVNTLGELSITRDGQTLALPSSKRTRALLAYLVMTARTHRRERLCEVFWKLPDDPRGALRWSLSKIRGLVNQADQERLAADRERVSLVSDDIAVDVRIMASQLDEGQLSTHELESMRLKLQEPLLDGLDLADQELYQQWLSNERLAVKKLRLRVLSLLAQHPQYNQHEQLHWARAWESMDSYNTKAARHLLTLLETLGLEPEWQSMRTQLAQRFQNAGVEWVDPAVIRAAQEAAKQDIPKRRKEFASRQTIQFCTAPDGVRLAHLSTGSGPTVVQAGHWITSLTQDWDAPTYSSLYRDLEQNHRLVRYDQRGCGLSDRDIGRFTHDDWVSDLETVVDANQLDRFALFGISQGASVAIEYAARHPERVSHLVLLGGFPVGWRNRSLESARETKAMIDMSMVGWDKDDPIVIRLLAVLLMPNTNISELNWFANYLRDITTQDMARRILYLVGETDVTEHLAKVQAPTLVAHSLGDRAIPVSSSRAIATAVAKAEFLGLESQNHIMFGREPAAQVFTETMLDFLSR